MPATVVEQALQEIQMSTLLVVKTSLFSDAGQSSRLADEVVGAWRNTHPHARVVVRDLALAPIPHLTAERFQALLTAPDERTIDQASVVEFSDALITELKQADEIVLAVPTYNFGIPSALKAYFDHIARAGVTFRYTAAGPVGLLGNRPVTIVAARGGFYAGTPTDTASRYLVDLLNFLGLSDVRFIYAEGLAISPAQKETSLQQAQEQILQLFAVERLADVA
jgi:FMN-dependent NADH-azoreductase